MLKSQLKDNSLSIFTLIITILYFFICYHWLFALTAPSDPLQYVAPALSPQGGFPFFDRILLWIWIRCFALLPLPSEQIGGVATLTLTCLSVSAPE